MCDDEVRTVHRSGTLSVRPGSQEQEDAGARTQVLWDESDYRKLSNTMRTSIERRFHRMNELGTKLGADWPAIRKADRKSTRLNSSHGYISYAVFCLKKKKEKSRD